MRVGAWSSVFRLSARLPSEGRSERDAPIGLLVGQNGGRQKKLLAAGCSDGGCGFHKAS